MVDLNLISSSVNLRSRALCAITSSCKLQNKHTEYRRALNKSMFFGKILIAFFQFFKKEINW